MKKLLLILVTIFLLYIGTRAQSGTGIKAGVNYTSLNGYTGDSRINFHAGVFTEIPLNKKWTIQPELLYSGEGQHYLLAPEDESATGGEGTITLSYASLPVMLRFSPCQRFYLEAGPQMAVLVTAHSKGMGTDGMNVKRSFTNGQFGLNLGAGFFFNQRIGIYGRYFFGMTDITPYDNDTDKSRAGQLGVAFRIGKQKIAKAKDKEPVK